VHPIAASPEQLQGEVQEVNDAIAPTIQGMNPQKQADVDVKIASRCADAPHLARVVSRLVLLAGAAAAQLPLYAHVRSLLADTLASQVGGIPPISTSSSYTIPVPCVSLVNGAQLSGVASTSLPCAELLLAAPKAQSAAHGVGAILRAHARATQALAQATNAPCRFGAAGGLLLPRTTALPLPDIPAPVGESGGPHLPQGSSAGADALVAATQWALLAMCIPGSQGGDAVEEAPPAASLDASLALVLHGLGEWAHLDSETDAPASSPRGSGRSKGKGKKAPPKKAPAKKGGAKGKKGGAAPTEGPVLVEVEEEGTEKYNLNVADTLAEEGEVEEVSAPMLHQLYHALAAEVPCMALVQPYAAGDKHAYAHTAAATLRRPVPGTSRSEAAGASEDAPCTLRSTDAPLVLVSDSSDGVTALAQTWCKEHLMHGLLLHTSSYSNMTGLIEAASSCIRGGVPLHLRHDEQGAAVLGTPVWKAPTPASALVQTPFLVELAMAMNAVSVQLCAPSTAAAAHELGKLTDLEASVPNCVWAGKLLATQQAAAEEFAVQRMQAAREDTESKK